MSEIRELMESVADLDFDLDLGVDIEDQDDDEQEPVRYVVNLHNDDYTEGMTVARVLQSVFGLSGEMAFQAMMSAHNHGKSTVASYGSKDVADTKAAQANDEIKAADPEYTEVFQVEKDT